MQTEPNDQRVVEEKNSSTETSSHSFLKETLKFAIIAFLIVTPFRIFVAQPFLVSGSSMSPTFETGDYLIIDEISYRFSEPQRGDVVVFKFPQDPSKFFIKRVIGLPEESVEIKNGEIFITTTDNVSGDASETDEVELHKLEEIYILNEHRENMEKITLENNEYFVMGDNRPSSSDSRYWGPLPERLIKGRAFLRLFPIKEIGLFPGSTN
jgi:signal peptidase I